MVRCLNVVLVIIGYAQLAALTDLKHNDGLEANRVERRRGGVSLKMEKLHSKYVFAPADKAANNVIIICKYYEDVLKGELNSMSTYVYVPAQLTIDKLLLHHIDTLAKINVKIDKCELPAFYWLPKLHKKSF